MAMKKNDTKKTASACIALSVSGDGNSLGVGAGSSSIKNKESKEQEIEYSCQALGGDVTILGKKCTNAKEFADYTAHQSQIQNEWSATVRDRMVGFNFQLIPLYNLVKHFNKTFGNDMENHLRQQWLADYNKVNELK